VKALARPKTTRRGSAEAALVTAAGGAQAPGTDEIFERILRAILEHRLPPGTKLGEEKLAAIFGVSRTKIRLVLSRLAHDRIVTPEANRGAFVSRPTVAEAREVFDARRLIEPALASRLAASRTPEQVARLRRHLAREEAARTGNDRRAIVRLTGEFHQMVAEMAGNSVLARTLLELESLTSLIIILYDSPKAAACPPHEHEELVSAIEAGDGERAARRMRAHLNHVEGALDYTLAADEAFDLEQAFSAGEL
jgi:DNA-binding GntR family transcriptional regulator